MNKKQIVEQHTFILTVMSQYSAPVQQWFTLAATVGIDLSCTFTSGTDLSALVGRLISHQQAAAAVILVAAVDELVGCGLLELEMRAASCS